MGTNIWLKVPLLSAMDWQRKGLCRSDPGLFDDPDHRHPGSAERKRLLKAVTICTGCPVREECLAFGKRNRYFGVFGGQLLRGGITVPLRELFDRGRSLSVEDKAARAVQREKAAS